MLFKAKEALGYGGPKPAGEISAGPRSLLFKESQARVDVGGSEPVGGSGKALCGISNDPLSGGRVLGVKGFGIHEHGILGLLDDDFFK